MELKPPVKRYERKVTRKKYAVFPRSGIQWYLLMAIRGKGWIRTGQIITDFREMRPFVASRLPFFSSVQMRLNSLRKMGLVERGRSEFDVRWRITKEGCAYLETARKPRVELMRERYVGIG